MYNVAIIGKDSYIGTNLACTLRKNAISVIEVESFDNKWVDFDFSSVDTVVHVAAIVHRKDINDPRIYDDINVKLPIEIAKRAQAAGVKQFVFMSSMAVYGKGHVTENCCIEPGDPLSPTTLYAKSKMQAESMLQNLIDNNMILSIIRPPSVYGRGCKGNLFDKYTKIANFLYLIPECEPSCFQGVLYIDNLSNAIFEIIRDRKSGCYHPQDNDLLTTAELLYKIRRHLGKKGSVSFWLGKAVSLLSSCSIYKKLFGSVYYSQDFKKQESLHSTMLSTDEGLRRMYEKEN